ncbi:MAG TPA: NAD(P)-dependent oxidoreductase [Candidatus Dormibacteraeota bacterium]|nr:NAD(P)-dependent oxidoreductase [Candidatus Dormibacteraeota bacterium]
MPEVVGVVGLGAMGAPMARNLERAGFTVAGYDVRGIGTAASVGEVATRATRAVIVLVRTRPQVEEVVAALERPGLDVVVMSTIDPGTMARLAGELAGRGLVAVDAPVSGGVAGAEAGTLAVMASGDPEAVARCRPLFEAVGGNLFVIGERPGMAQAVKLANQLMLAASMVAVEEGLRLAAGHGVSPADVLPVIERSTGASWAAANWETVLGWWRDYEPGGALDIVVKDLRSLLDEAAERRVSLPAAAVALQRLHDVWR